MKKSSQTSQPSSPQLQQWNRITNMRTTLLHLQYLHASLTTTLNAQSQAFNLHHQDRLLQVYQLYRDLHLTTTTNLKTLEILKLQQTLSISQQIDKQLYQKLQKFLLCWQYLHGEIGRDLARLYIGAGGMLDIQKCHLRLKDIQDQLANWMGEAKGVLGDYGRMVDEGTGVREGWAGYLGEVRGFVDKIKPYYKEYLRNRLASREKELQVNINKLMELIKS